MYYKLSEEAAEADCRQKWRIWSPREVLNVWPAYQHPLPPDMYVPGRGTIWSFEQVARTIRPSFDPYLKEWGNRNTFVSNWIALTNFTWPAGYQQGTPALHCCWRLQMDIGIRCLMHCRQKFVYCSGDCGIEVSIGHSILQCKSYIPEWAAVEEVDRYLLLTIVKKQWPTRWSWWECGKNKQGCGLLFSEVAYV